MLADYTAAGFDPAAFWGLSPRLYLAQMRGAHERLKREQEGRAWLAWHGAALERSKKLPDLRRFVTGRSAKPQRQTPEVLQAMCDALATAWGAKRANPRAD